MTVSVAYDVTRLAARFTTQTPNGIDRVDLAFAQYFTNPGRPGQSGILANIFGSRAIPAVRAHDIVRDITFHWRETSETADTDPAYARVTAWLRGETPNPGASSRVGPSRMGPSRVGPSRVVGSVTPSLQNIARLGGLHRGLHGALRVGAQLGLPSGRDPVAAVPRNAIYLNVSQFPIWIPRYLA